LLFPHLQKKKNLGLVSSDQETGRIGKRHLVATQGERLSGEVGMYKKAEIPSTR
jgi:hypothetical protein